MARHPAARKAAGVDRYSGRTEAVDALVADDPGAAAENAGEPVDPGADVDGSVEAAEAEIVDGLVDVEPADLAEAIAGGDGVDEAVIPDEPVKPDVPAEPMAGIPVRAETSGLEPVLAMLQAALDRLDAALVEGGGVRSTMTALSSGAPGDDRDVIGFIRRRLAPTQDRLLGVLAGLSEERRALEDVRLHLDRIHGRSGYDPTDALGRAAALTGLVRSTPVAALPEQRKVEARPPSDVANPPAAGTSATDTDAANGQFAERAAASELAPSAVPSTGPSAVARLAGALRRSAGQALGVIPAADEPAGHAVTGDATAPDVLGRDVPLHTGPEAQPCTPSAAEPGPLPLHPAHRNVPAPVRRTARYAMLIGLPALVFSGMGGTPPHVEAGPRPVASLAPYIAVATPVPADAPYAVVEAPVIPTGDDTSVGFPGPTPFDGDAASPSPDSIVDASEAGSGAIVVFHGPTNRKVVALTFDDGYAPANILQIFNTLVANKVQATFFVNGVYLSRAPALWKEIAAAGFAVGNHTYHHLDVTTLSAAELTRELTQTAVAWKRTTGTDLIPYFRPPYGAHNDDSDATAAAAGYRHIVLWSNSAVDGTVGTSAAAATAAALKGAPGAIVLLHAGPNITSKILQAVINGYRARGFEFVTIPELLGK